MEKEIPRIDLPEEWIAGTDFKRDLLNLYTNYPVRLKCEIMVLCMGGEVEATVNVNRIQVKKNDIAVLTPGNIIQIHRVEGDLRLYVLGFSQQYVEHNNQGHAVPEAFYLALNSPKLTLKPAEADMLEDFFRLLIKLYNSTEEKMRKKITPNLYNDAHTYISILYRSKETDRLPSSKKEQLCRNFAQLVYRHYAETRNVAWYAQKLNITHAYLCTIVKQVTKSTCADIISYMVIMDAKSQLKLTNLSIQEISDSLSFANVSFFGKYFKRYVGMSPLAYRNKG